MDKYLALKAVKAFLPLLLGAIGGAAAAAYPAYHAAFCNGSLL